MKKCPYCAELIGSNSKSCKYCGESLTQTTKSTKQRHPLLKITVLSIISLLAIGFVALYIYGTFLEKETIRIIKSAPLIKEQKSESGFKVTLPSDNWRFLKKEDGLKIFGDFIKDYDMVVTDSKGEIVGAFYGYDIQGAGQELLNEDFLESMSETTKKEFGSEIKVINELKTNNAILLEGKYMELGTEKIITASHKIFNNIAATCVFIGELEKYNSLRNDVFTFVDNIEEISRKEFMPKLSAAEIYKKYSDAITLVRIYDKNGNPIGFSTGFNVGEEGVIVTNLHTILEGYHIDVKFPLHGTYEEVYISGLSKTLNDLVVLAMNGKDLPYVDLSNSMEIEIGDKVIAIGNPEGLVNTISEGIISGMRYLGEYPYYQMTAPISPGSSGGAVFDECGNIIGISTFYLEGGQNLNFCIPISELGNIEVFEEGITLAQFQEFLKEERKKK